MMSSNEERESTHDVATMMSENLIMIQALWEIIQVSADAETVRIAMSALTRTDSGMTYIRANPMIL